MKHLSKLWQKGIIWLTSYVNLIAFFVAGGYLFLNTGDDDIRVSFKNALLCSAGFTLLTLFFDVLYYLLSIFGAGYDTLNFINKIDYVIFILKIAAYVTLFVMDVKGKRLIIKKEDVKEAFDPENQI